MPSSIFLLPPHLYFQASHPLPDGCPATVTLRGSESMPSPAHFLRWCILGCGRPEKHLTVLIMAPDLLTVTRIELYLDSILRSKAGQFQTTAKSQGLGSFWEERIFQDIFYLNLEVMSSLGRQVCSAVSHPLKPEQKAQKKIESLWFEGGHPALCRNLSNNTPCLEFAPC